MKTATFFFIFPYMENLKIICLPKTEMQDYLRAALRGGNRKVEGFGAYRLLIETNDSSLSCLESKCVKRF
jgi:hypothetical protein